MTMITEVKHKPLGKRLLVKRAAANEKVGKGLLHAPTRFAEAPMMGRVIARGSKCEEVKEGDVVAFANWAGVSLAKLTADAGAEGLLLLDEEHEVLCVLEEHQRKATAEEETALDAKEKEDSEAFLARLRAEVAGS